MNCERCKYKEDPDGGYCYMWKDKPTECHYYSGYKMSKSVQKKELRYKTMTNENRGDNQDPYEMTKDWLVLSKDDFKNKYGRDWTPPEHLIGKVKKELSSRKDKKGEYRT